MEYINLDITPGSIPPIVNCSQCDIGREIGLILYDGTSGEWTIPTGSVVYILGTKSDNHPFGYDSTTNPDVISYEDSTVIIKTTQQMTLASGEAECEIRIDSGSSQIYTANFILSVETMAYPQNDEISSIDIPLIIKAINGETNSTASAKESAASADASAASAKLSQSWAVGGTSSRSGEDTNNSKYYAQQSANSASAAATSASNAKTYETNAASSKTAAANSATAAKTSETNAKTSETNAKTSETNAKTSETNAKTSETNAASSETAAKTSETNAKTSETNAKSYMDTAKSYVDSNYAVMAKSYAVGGTGTRDGEDTDNAAWYYNNIKDTDVGNLAELEKKVEANLNAVNHNQDVYPAFFADRLADVTDLNTCTTNGLYSFTESTSNTPVSGIGLCAVFNSVASGETGYITQYAWLGSDAHTVYARYDHNGTFGEWKVVGADLINSIAPLTVDDAPVAEGTNSIAVGNGAVANGTESISIGYNSNASKVSTVFGALAKTSYIESIAIGYYALAKKSYSVAIGPVAIADGRSSVAIGTGAKTTEANTVSVGCPNPTDDAIPATRRIINVTDPTNDQDAATKAYVDSHIPIKLATQSLTADGGTLTFTDDSIGDDSFIDVYASIANIAPSDISQTGNTVTVTFDAQDAAFNVGIVVFN